ncbi:MAG: aminotransferase class III-fold pyridoxal phosphate-dependent enzyme, partial [Myxococcales bacterium]|nr:aminotransferase class III-fold pyridoxal phosphate-dependent enzyme [Myxococcales bacterium]
GVMSVGQLPSLFGSFAPLLFGGQSEPPLEGETAWRSYFASLCERVVDEADEIAAVVVEPIVLGVAGMRMYAPELLADLRAACDRADTFLIADEVFTGFGRTGRRFASEGEGLVPDLLCVGKALGGGLPISACLGRAEVMAAWGDPDREAIHTGTFFGNPVSCAAALAALDILDHSDTLARVREEGEALGNRLRLWARNQERPLSVSGRGMLWGLTFPSAADALRTMVGLLDHGYITLTAGTKGNVLQIVPPFFIERERLIAFEEVLDRIVQGLP